MSAAIPLARREPSAPPYRPNALLRWLMGRFFRHIKVDEQWVADIRRARRRIARALTIQREREIESA